MIFYKQAEAPRNTVPGARLFTPSTGGVGSHAQRRLLLFAIIALLREMCNCPKGKAFYVEYVFAQDSVI